MEIGKALASILPENRIKTRLIDLVAYASDAGFYHLQPKAVVQPVSETEIRSLFAFSHTHQIPLTFRTGGTSLSGQSITDGILVDLSQYWRGVAVENEGETVRVQPGVIGSVVNAHLKKYKRKMGPDPSSINAAMMGGILSNNSSGMCCGVHQNSYHTAKHIKFILPNGKAFSTEYPADYRRFEAECPEIYQALTEIKAEVATNEPLYQRIREKYKTKNTVGYSLNAIADYTHPLDILAHLLIGAEGTLGFIAEAVMQTVPDYPYKSMALLYFTDIYAACHAIVPLAHSGAEAIELMDRASLRSIEHIKGTPDILKTLPEGASALLIEYQANSSGELEEKVTKFFLVHSQFPTINFPLFTEDAKEQAFLWKLRKGMFPAVGAVRASGTTVILEDIAFPVEKLDSAILDLQDLFKKHGYDNAIIFGHAKDGNIHFVITQSFNATPEITRYDTFIKEVVALVVNKYDGTLKAEHGTGRNMAPFVATEWGSEAYAIMKRLKQTIDPKNLLNPGVIINEDKNAHLKNLKELFAVEEEVDKCIECGYCEHKCPSRDLTLTPRRRIVVRRELAKQKSEGNKHTYSRLLNQYRYDGLDTCAVDGLCATDCPVDINTGDLVKRLRKESHGSFGNRVAVVVAKNFRLTEAILKLALKSGILVNRVFGKNAMTDFTAGMRRIIPSFPVWMRHLAVATHLPTRRNADKAMDGNKTIVYFPTCISRMMGGSSVGKKSVVQTFLSVADKAGIKVVIPKNNSRQCCGQAFSSKGYAGAFAYTANRTIEALWKDTEGGIYPIVLDVTSCTYTLQHCGSVLSRENKEKFEMLSIIDSIDFLHDYVVPYIDGSSIEKNKTIVLHPVCSLQKMQLHDKFVKVAMHFAENIIIPMHAGCCGMAGDRGFLFPELTRVATHAEATEVKQQKADGCYSSAKTCEMAMSEATGKNYESILYLADEVM